MTWNLVWLTCHNVSCLLIPYLVAEIQGCVSVLRSAVGSRQGIFPVPITTNLVYLLASLVLDVER